MLWLLDCGGYFGKYFGDWYVVYAYVQEHTIQVSAGIVFIFIIFSHTFQAAFTYYIDTRNLGKHLLPIIPIALNNMNNYQVPYYDITWCQSIELDTIPVI